MSEPILMTDKEIQSYIVNGYTTIETGPTPSFHEKIHQKIKTLYATEGNPGNEILSKVSDLNIILEDPYVTGSLCSLLGPDYLIHPHRHCHQNLSGSEGQNMHQDSYEDDRNVRHHRTRWAMAFYYPQDTTFDMGPTSILPASQYYTTHAEALRQKELPLIGKAGTVTIVHYDLWHRAMPNYTQQDRFMVKFLFARMSEPQMPTWNHKNSSWDDIIDDPPKAVCIRAWDWMRGSEKTDLKVQNSLQALKQKLLSNSEKKRIEAVYALADIGEDSLPTLVESLRSQAENNLEENSEKLHTNPIQSDTTVGFSSIGQLAIPCLIELLSDNKWWLRAAAADILGDIGEKASESVPFLLKLLDDSSPWVQRNAIEALGNIGPNSAKAVSKLSASLKAPQSWVRHNAALALAKIGPKAKEAIPELKMPFEDVYTSSHSQIALDRIHQ